MILYDIFTLWCTSNSNVGVNYVILNIYLYTRGGGGGQALAAELTGRWNDNRDNNINTKNNDNYNTNNNNNTNNNDSEDA